MPTDKKKPTRRKRKETKRPMNTTAFERAEWIWRDGDYTENDYAEFFEKICYDGTPVTVRLSVCGDYTLFVNGNYVSSNQYADFPHYKIYDSIDISDFLHSGENTVAVLAWYFGKSGMRHVTPRAGLIYEIADENGILAYSGTHTLARKSKAYKCGIGRKITGQLGYGFDYDAGVEDNWKTGEGSDFHPARIAFEKSELFPRPTKRLAVGSLKKAARIDSASGYLFDLGEESVGFLSLSLRCDSRQKLTISYSEILENGRVKRVIGPRDFRVEYRTTVGQNVYTNHMLRLACRYIEIECEEPINVEYIGIVPHGYPTVDNENFLTTEPERAIYDVCVRTLKLCMLEHYVDCPWREQCLYAFDSRNQILAGYAAFADGNFEYVRANLLLMSKDRRPDDLLAICFPCGEDLTIPSFSLYYALAVKEYLQYSGDLSLGQEVIDKIESELSAFAKNMRDGLVCKFDGADKWNFYDWSPYAEPGIGTSKNVPDLLINAIFLLALDSYDDICRRLGRKNRFDGLSVTIRSAARRAFFDSERRLFFIHEKSEQPTELANSLAVITEIADKADAEYICEKLANGELVPCSLSMRTFKYDAMLMTDKNAYATVVLDEIRKTYSHMLREGATSVWETADGAAAFDNAGSLCHGWSAIPVYYYDLLLGDGKRLSTLAKKQNG